MFSQKEVELISTLDQTNASGEVVPERLQNHATILLAQILESGRSQRFFGADPYAAAEFSKDEITNAVKELRWEGFVDIADDDVDGDGIKESVLHSGWTTNDSGIEFLRRIKSTAGIE